MSAKVSLQVYKGKPFNHISPMINSEDCMVVVTRIEGKQKLISFSTPEACWKFCEDFKEKYPNFNNYE